MKKYIYLLAILFFWVNNYAFSEPKTQNPNDLIIELAKEIKNLNEKFSHVLEIKEKHMLSLNKSLLVAISVGQKIDLLLQKDILKEEINSLKIDNNSEIAKIRYLKGLQIIKILYEKRDKKKLRQTNGVFEFIIIKIIILLSAPAPSLYNLSQQRTQHRNKHLLSIHMHPSHFCNNRFDIQAYPIGRKS